MPVISSFQGISIKMYYQQSEHNPPHIHAFYGEYVIAISIIDRTILDGYFPPRQLSLIKSWIVRNRDNLIIMWNTQSFTNLPPL